VRRPTTHEELCDLDYLEISWECYFEKRRFDLQPGLVGRNHRDEHVYSVEAVPTNAMGHLPVMLRSTFQFSPPPPPAAPSFPSEPAAAGLTLVQSSAPPLTAPLSAVQPAAATELRRDFLLFDVFDAVLAEITFHGDPAERDRWWREIGSHGLDFTDRPSEDRGRFLRPGDEGEASASGKRTRCRDFPRGAVSAAVTRGALRALCPSREP